MAKDLLEARNILLIKNYDFGDGSPTKDKIALIIATDSQVTFVIQALVTSQQKIPDKRVRHGCTNSKDGYFSFYCFEKGRGVGMDADQEEFAFRKNTFIFFQDNVMEITREHYQPMLSRVQPLAQLSEDEYKRLKKCLLKSKLLKRKIKRKLEALL